MLKLSRLATFILATGIFGKQAPAYADVRVTLSWIERQHVIKPEPEHDEWASRSLTYVISTNGAIKWEYDLGPKVVQKGERKLGVPQGNNEGTLASRVRVEQNAIIIATFQPSYKIITRIETDGKANCTAERTYEKVGGHQYFEMHHVKSNYPMSVTAITITSMSCKIQDI